METSLVDFTERFPSVQYWMDSLTCRENTKRSYLLHFRNFTRWLKKDPEQLIAERKEEREDDDPRIRHNAEHQLRRYINYLKSQNYARDTVRLAYYSVRSFYDNNYFGLDMKASEAPKKGMRRDRATKEQVATLMKVANTREKAIITFLKDSGLSVGDVARLSYKDIEADFEKNKAFIAIRFVRKKTGIPALTFVGPEAIENLKTYFEARQRGTQDSYPPSMRDKGVPPEEITSNSPLFVQHDKTHAMLKPKDITRIITRLAAKAGVEDVSPHRIRKLFQTCLEDARVPFNWIQHFMAHKPLGVEGNYSLPSETQLHQAYEEAYKYLELEPSRLGVEKELEAQREKIRELEQKNVELKQRLNGEEKAGQEIKKRLDELSKAEDEIQEMFKKAEKILRISPSIAGIMTEIETVTKKKGSISEEEMAKLREKYFPQSS